RNRQNDALPRRDRIACKRHADLFGGGVVLLLPQAGAAAFLASHGCQDGIDRAACPAGAAREGSAPALRGATPQRRRRRIPGAGRRKALPAWARRFPPRPPRLCRAVLATRI